MTLAGNRRLAGLLCLVLLGLPAILAAQTPGDDPCRDIAGMLAEQNTKLAGDLRRIHREIAALRADMDKPGMRDVLAGIGYIAGLFGAAALVAARRRG